MQPFIPYTLHLPGRELVIDHPLIMGILNVTPDSFWAGSRCDTQAKVEARVRQMIDEGVDIIDIGAYSTRPGAQAVSSEDELRRLEAGMQVVRRLAPQVPVSVDTFRAQVARQCVEHLGVDMVNDVAGGTLDPHMFATVAALGVPYVMMHMRGTPATMQQLTDYGDVTREVCDYLALKIGQLHQLGVRDVIADPGFGFSKTVRQNFELMARLPQFQALQVPLLVGISRKSMIFKTLGCTPAQSLSGTTALNTVALMGGAHIVRVHDVRPAVEARAMVQAVREAAEE